MQRKGSAAHTTVWHPPYSGTTLTFTTTGFSSYYVTLESAPQHVSSSSSNSESSFRVIFSTDGVNAGTVAAGLSYSDRVAKPTDPDQRTVIQLGGWYRNIAYTIP